MSCRRLNAACRAWMADRGKVCARRLRWRLRISRCEASKEPVFQAEFRRSWRVRLRGWRRGVAIAMFAFRNVWRKRNATRRTAHSAQSQRATAHVPHVEFACCCDYGRVWLQDCAQDAFTAARALGLHGISGQQSTIHHSTGESIHDAFS